ncbi:MAG: ABC transporter permease subunit [Archangium sp.]|nr:ABC transporter permease subunit [Archangium sp.]MDP3152412.1 ABC transporter permease subunit [Archangium sp.]
MEDFHEIGAIWRGETRRALRSGRVLVLLILFLLFVGLSLTVGAGLSRIADSQLSLATGGATPTAEQVEGPRKQFLQTFVTEDEAMLESLAAIPLMLLAVFKVTLRFLPLFIALMGFDQLAGEVGPKSVRYLVVRVKRSSIILGKLLSQMTLFALLMSICTVLMVLVAKILNPLFAPADVAFWTGKLIISSMVLSLAYLSLTALFSALVKQGGVSLVLNVIALFVIWFVALIGSAWRLPGELAMQGSLSMIKAESAWGYIRYASVWQYGDDLLHPHWGRFLTAALVHVGFGLVFLGLAQLALRKRDL